MRDEAQRINGVIVSDVANRQRDKWYYYHDLKKAIAAIDAGAPYFDIEVSKLKAAGWLTEIPAISRRVPSGYEDTYKIFDAPKPWQPFVAECGFRVDGRILTAKDAYGVYEEALSTSGDIDAVRAMHGCVSASGHTGHEWALAKVGAKRTIRLYPNPLYIEAHKND